MQTMSKITLKRKKTTSLRLGFFGGRPSKGESAKSSHPHPYFSNKKNSEKVFEFFELLSRYFDEIS